MGEKHLPNAENYKHTRINADGHSTAAEPWYVSLSGIVEISNAQECILIDSGRGGSPKASAFTQSRFTRKSR